MKTDFGVIPGRKGKGYIKRLINDFIGHHQKAKPTLIPPQAEILSAISGPR